MTGSHLTALTRIGFAARGLLYIVIALLVIETGRSEDPSGQVRTYAYDELGRTVTETWMRGWTTPGGRSTKPCAGSRRS